MTVGAGDAGYSGTPLARKLGIRPGHRLALLHAPPGLLETLALPPDVTVLRQARAPLDVVVLFATDAGPLARELPRIAERLDPAGGLWVAWPKRSSGVPTDLVEDRIRELALAIGLVDNKVCAIDATWSGLRLVYRLRDRPGRRPAVG